MSLTMNKPFALTPEERRIVGRYRLMSIRNRARFWRLGIRLLNRQRRVAR